MFQPHMRTTLRQEKCNESMGQELTHSFMSFVTRYSPLAILDKRHVRGYGNSPIIRYLVFESF